MTDYKDYKQLCVELVEIWDNTSDPDYWDFGDAAKDLVIRARAALAEPEAPINWAAYFVRQAVVQEQELKAAMSQPEPEGPTNEELYDLMYEFTIGTGHGERLDEIGFARALLARWGHRSAPQPVPMSERVQQIEDLAADAVSGLRYIEQQHGRLYGVGWDRVYAKADRLLSAG